MREPPVRTQDPFVPLTKAPFRARFCDPALDRVFETGAWHAPDEGLRDPREK